jgi:SAM-dependent methyltransferase
MSTHLFDFSGFAANEDLEKEEWRVLFNSLEKEQYDFLKHQDDFRSEEYKWPRDPLHTWSRLWEYPYVYHHILKKQAQRPSEKLRILDFGSGVTFFPFVVGQLGCDVICADIDTVVAEDIPAAAKWMSHAPGTIDVAIIEDGRIPVESESQDVVYCISVLEHIPNFEFAIVEIFRVLKPGGQLILTVDVDLMGNSELGVNGFERLQTILNKHFKKNLPERPVHPLNLLTTSNSPYNMKRRSPFFIFKQLIKNVLRGNLVNCDPRVEFFLGAYACILMKGEFILQVHHVNF